jgi:RHS repeat-associated protein
VLRNSQLTQTATGEKLVAKYDAAGRRSEVQELSASNVILRTTRYLYDGWNPVAEFDIATTGGAITRQKTHTWGLDLSQSPQGAGGVGGLLATADELSTKAIKYFAYDGNGNVAALYTPSFGLAAAYEYDAFGNTLSASGPYAAENKYRFSTKPQDRIGSLYYYGYRYYDPSTGRWINRDPIQEMGGVNLYDFVGNDSVNRIDLLGMKKCSEYSKSKNINGKDKGRTKNQKGKATGNGCGTAGGVRPPQGFGGTDFTSACNSHDKCYGECGKDKATCDQTFGDDLANACKSGQTGVWKAACLADAATYKNAVIGLGSSAYETAQDDFCEWEECCK